MGLVPWSRFNKMELADLKINGGQQTLVPNILRQIFDEIPTIPKFSWSFAENRILWKLSIHLFLPAGELVPPPGGQGRSTTSYLPTPYPSTARQWNGGEEGAAEKRDRGTGGVAENTGSRSRRLCTPT